MLALLLPLFLFLFLLSIPIVRLLRRMFTSPPPRPKPLHSPHLHPLNLLVVLGSGGHTSEMLTLLHHLIPSFPNISITYITTATDHHSMSKASQMHSSAFKHIPHSFHIVPRAREVGQSYTSSIFTSLKCLAVTWGLVAKIAPDVVLTNGPATGAIVAWVAVLQECLWGKKLSIIFVESWARVVSLSVSGRLLYRVADRVLVQWEQVAGMYRKAEYYGRLC